MSDINNTISNTTVNDSDNTTVNDSNNINDKKIDFSDISINVVLFERTFSRSRGTVSQIVKSLSDMADRLSTPTNAYQEGLYPHIQKECKTTVEQYNKLIDSIDQNDYYVFGFYLNGPSNDGKRKATTTPHERKSYGVSEYKETLKSVNDRLRHIKIDCIRKSRESAKNNHDVFDRLIEFCDKFHKVINEHLKTWDDFIGEFRNQNGVVRESNNNLDNKSNNNFDNTNQNNQQNISTSRTENKELKIRVKVRDNANSTNNTNNVNLATRNSRENSKNIKKNFSKK